MMLIAGDIGGTKTILALFSSEMGYRKPVIQKTYASTQFEDLESIIEEFSNNFDHQVQGACLAVAGPVVSEKVRITNLSWSINANQLKSRFGWEFSHLMNDLEAVAYAVPSLKAEDIHQISSGKPISGGNISVIAPGTGLGEAFLTFSEDAYEAHASEGSHASFAPNTDLQVKLLNFMKEVKGFEHVSFERVCSGGLGIPNLYDFLKYSGIAEEPDWLAEAIGSTDDPTPIIIFSALKENHPNKLCLATLDLFVSILGSEAGNQALKVMATGGIYLGGGIPPRIIPKLQEPLFIDSLRAKGRFKALLSDIPVYIIKNPQAGLLGASSYGFSHYQYPKD